jgi:hypothetical protein
MSKKIDTVEVEIEKKEETPNVVVSGTTYSASSVIITNDAVYQISLLPENLEDEDYDEEGGVAYLGEEYFYIFRGLGNPANMENKKPGIYKNNIEGEEANKFPKYFRVDPETEEEKHDYRIDNHIFSLNVQSVIDTANNKEDLLIAIPESTKIFQPQITENDDILKLIAKKVLLAKNVDLDRYKDRFTNKNELFNFKQVLRGSNKLSMKIFNRGMEAMNLEYLIVVREKSDTDVVGDPLTNPVAVSSEETYAA